LRKARSIGARLRDAALLVAAIGLAGIATAQSGKPLKLLVPTSPGSSADIGARAVGDRLQKSMGRPVVIENKVGAGGSIAAAAVAAADSNGDTIGVLGNSYLLFHVEFPNQKFDPQRDVVPVAMISRGSNVLLVSSSSAYLKMDDLLRRAREQPGRVVFASAGLASSTYQSAERLRLAAGLDLIHVPFKGAPELIQELAAGRADFAFVPLPVAAPFIRDGRMRALAVSSSKRAAALPQVPTTAEAGLPASTYDSWLVALVPANTPVAAQAELNRAFNAALEAPEVLKQFEALGVEAQVMSLQDVKGYVQQEYAKAIAFEKDMKPR
jgi:tripartite-type tricarboxylate transporter receptor subunit TctC